MKEACALTVDGIVLLAHLGWSKEERAQPQKIRIWLRLVFLQGLKATETDDLADTYCYNTLTQKYKAFLSGKEFHLIETLGHQLYELTRAEIPLPVVLSFRVTKLHPPVPELEGGVTFECGAL